MEILIWLLKILGLKKWAAVLEAYLAEEAQEQAAQIQQATQAQAAIVQEEQYEETQVATADADQLAADAVALGLVRDDASSNNGGAAPQ